MQNAVETHETRDTERRTARHMRAFSLSLSLSVSRSLAVFLFEYNQGARREFETRHQVVGLSVYYIYVQQGLALKL